MQTFRWPPLRGSRIARGKSAAVAGFDWVGGARYLRYTAVVCDGIPGRTFDIRTCPWTNVTRSSRRWMVRTDGSEPKWRENRWLGDELDLCASLYCLGHSIFRAKLRSLACYEAIWSISHTNSCIRCVEGGRMVMSGG
jgi:hypothetical protein